MAVATQPRTTTQTQTREGTPTGADLEKVLRQTEEDIAALRARIDDSHPGLSRAVATSTALQRARKLVTPKFLEDYVMPLMNSPLGFMTDKKGDKGTNDFYRPGDLVEPVVEALIRGFNIAGNEMNVIAGRFYGAQNGYRRLVRELPGLTDLEEIPGTPMADNGSTVVRFIVRCKINGKEWVLKNEKGEPGRKFTIRVNSGMGPDAILGKAARKALKAAYEEITGTPLTESDDAEALDKTLPPEIPQGRSKLKDLQPTNGNGHSAPAPQADESQETIPGDSSEIIDDADAEAIALNLQDAIDMAANLKDTAIVGAKLNEAKSQIGDGRYDSLLKRLQTKNKELGMK